MECPKCKKMYKNSKTLEMHMKRMHDTGDEVEIIQDAESNAELDELADKIADDIANKIKNEITNIVPIEEKCHECNACVKCKDDIKYLKTAVGLLVQRHVGHLQFREMMSKNTETCNKNFDEFERTISGMNAYIVHLAETVELLTKERNIKTNNKKNNK